MRKSVPPPSDRSFGITFTVVFALITIWLWWTGRPGPMLFGILSLATLLVSAFRPSLLKALNRAWMKLGALLHAVVNPVVLAFLYFGVITPFAIVMRLIRRDVLRRRFEPTERSYWIRRDPPGPAPDSLPRQS